MVDVPHKRFICYVKLRSLVFAPAYILSYLISKQFALLHKWIWFATMIMIVILITMIVIIMIP